MEASSDSNRSILRAIGTLIPATAGDLGYNITLRHRLLAKLWITQKRFELGAREISYLLGAKSDDLPPVLFLHGTPGSAVDWRWFLKHAADKFSVYAMDRPGFGVVDKKPPMLEQDFEILRELLAIAFAHGEKVIVVGHSLGGGLAARLAADYPDMVKGLVLVGASLDPALERIQPIRRSAARAPLSWLLTRSVRNSNAELLQYPEFLSRLQPGLARIRCPVAVVHSRDDGLAPYANVDYAQRHFSNAEVKIVSLDTGGHFLNKWRPKAVFDAVKSVA